nr:MAG TPA: hypothetical protein [Caudoviricetes sp.]
MNTIPTHLISPIPRLNRTKSTHIMNNNFSLKPQNIFISNN